MPPQRYWMSTAKLRGYARAGLKLEEIAERNEKETGWRPDKSTVSKKLRDIGEDARHASRSDLTPWKIRPEHVNSRFRVMLQAESRRRTGAELSDTDRKAINLLEDLIMGRGTPLVVGYHPEIGFYLTDRNDSDQDIIRVSHADHQAHALQTA